MDWVIWLDVVLLAAIVYNLTQSAYYIRKAERKRQALAKLLRRR